MEKPLSRPRLHSGSSKPRRDPPPPRLPPPPQPKTLYDEVFGGPPRHGVPVLSPRTEDYLEIFGGFHAPSRPCFRLPVLDLPVAEGDEVLVDVRGGGFDYSEVFGRGEGEDVGLLDFEVVSRSDDVGGSSYGDGDDAWTPEGSDCLSEDSEFCGYDQTFSRGNPYMSVDGEMEHKMSFHEASHGTTLFDDMRHTSQIQSIPGFSYVVGETPGIEKKVNPHPSKRQTCNSNSNMDYGWERVKEKEQKKVLLHSSSAISQGKSNDYTFIRQEQFGRVKSFPAESFVTISEISLRTAPSNLPPPSRPPPGFDFKTSDARGSTSSWRKNSPECDSLPEFFDVEVDGGSSAAAATGKTIDKALSQLKGTKVPMERRKDCLLGPEMSGNQSDANYMTKEGSLFADSMSSQRDNRVHYDNHRVNNATESSVTDKIRNIAGKNQDEVMKGKVIEGAARSEQIWPEKEGTIPHSEFVGDDRMSGAPDLSEGYDLFYQSKKSDQGSGIRDGMSGKEVFDTKANGMKSREWKETRNLMEGQVENKIVMNRDKEKGVEVGEVSERNDLGKNEVIEKHSDTNRAAKAPQTAPQMETHAGGRDAVGVKHQGGLDAVAGYVGVFDSAIRQALEPIHDNEDLMVSESSAQFQDVQGSLLYEKTQKVVDPEKYERVPRADAQLIVVQNEEKMTSGSDGSVEEILHYVANDARKEDVIEHVQKKDRLPVVVERDKVKVVLAGPYLKERPELEGPLESASGRSKLNVHKPECADMTLGDSYVKHELKKQLKEANQQNEHTKLEDFSKNREEVPPSGAVEQKVNERGIVDLLEREEMEKVLKRAFPSGDKEKEPNESTTLEDIGNWPLESCRNSSINEAAPEQDTIEESLKEADKYVHTNDTLVPRHEKAEILEHENAGQHEEAVNESDDDIEWEIVGEGLCEVVGVRELDFLNQAHEKIPVHEVSEPHYSEDGQFDLEYLGNSETHAEPIALRVNGHDVQTEGGFNGATTELTEPTDERASPHSKRDLKSKQPGSDFFGATEAVQEEKYVDGRMMDSETTAIADQTNCSISCEEAMEQGMEFKGDSELYDIPLHQVREISSSSQSNCGFDGGMVRETSLPDLEDRTSQRQSVAQSEEKKEKRVVPEVRDTVRVSREQEAELERLRKIEEDKEREREREKDRMVVDKAAFEARESAISEARERFEKGTVERATAESSRRAMMEARERLEKACAEARERLFSEKSATEERLRLERASVERAIAEARGRAAERAKVNRSASDKFSSPMHSDIRQCLSSSDNRGEAKTSGSVEIESAQRRRARLERHRRTAERAAKALADKNTRDLLALREQAERSRLAETLDADVRRWSKGKEGNLRALLSTMQYILGPDCGWQPIPLTEVITSAAVKKAYRKATLCVHPDKLQQRGASIQQKYICEKVFDLLKEGWNKFNSEER